MITKKEAAKVRKAADMINKGRIGWSCWALKKCGSAKLVREYSKFYDQVDGNGDGAKWPGLIMGSTDYDRYTQEQILLTMQRELMLELFAHTRGKL
jgi:hypothetical protein